MCVHVLMHELIYSYLFIMFLKPVVTDALTMHQMSVCAATFPVP